MVVFIFPFSAKLYNAHGHKLRFPPSKKAQFVTALGIAVNGRRDIFGYSISLRRCAIRKNAVTSNVLIKIQYQKWMRRISVLTIARNIVMLPTV